MTAVCWNSKTRQWVSASEDRTIRIWDEDSPRCVQVIVNNAEVTALHIDAFNGCVIAGGRDRVLRVYDGDAVMQKNVGHKDEIRAITHLYGRNQYATASWDGTIKVWNAFIKKGQRRHEYSRVSSSLPLSSTLGNGNNGSSIGGGGGGDRGDGGEDGHGAGAAGFDAVPEPMMDSQAALMRQGGAQSPRLLHVKDLVRVCVLLTSDLLC